VALLLERKDLTGDECAHYIVGRGLVIFP
jgi:hypothetical protein